MAPRRGGPVCGGQLCTAKAGWRAEPVLPRLCRKARGCRTRSENFAHRACPDLPVARPAMRRAAYSNTGGRMRALQFARSPSHRANLAAPAKRRVLQSALHHIPENIARPGPVNLELHGRSHRTVETRHGSGLFSRNILCL